MKLYVGLTNGDWFHRLSDLAPDEVNFWQRSGEASFGPCHRCVSISVSFEKSEGNSVEQFLCERVPIVAISLGISPRGRAQGDQRQKVGHGQWRPM